MKDYSRLLPFPAFRKAAALALLATGVASTTLTADTIATPSTSLNSDGWALGAASMSGYTAALTNTAYFGPAGVVTTSVTLAQQSAVNAGSLAGVDVFIAPWWNDAQAAPSATAVKNFFLGGGNLFLLQDDPSHDGIGAALGITSFNSGVNPTTVTSSALNNGSFGTISTVFEHFTQGYLDGVAILAMGGTIAATDSLGRATMGIWDYGDYAVGSGRMVIMADVDYISTAGGANYTTLSSGAILGLNATEYLLQKNSVPDHGSTLLLLIPACLGLAGAGYRRRRA